MRSSPTKISTRSFLRSTSDTPYLKSCNGQLGTYTLQATSSPAQAASRKPKQGRVAHLVEPEQNEAASEQHVIFGVTDSMACGHQKAHVGTSQNPHSQPMVLVSTRWSGFDAKSREPGREKPTAATFVKVGISAAWQQSVCPPWVLENWHHCALVSAKSAHVSADVSCLG